MQDTRYPDIAPDFGHWLAGFLDGEGCFAIISNPRREEGSVSYRCRCVVSLRRDDEPILREIQRTTGLGRVRHTNPNNGTRQRPQVRWNVDAKRECARLVQILDAHPLRAKKAADYAIWREAVREWGLVRNGRTRVRHDYTEFLRLKAAIEAVRRYPDDEADEVDDLSAEPSTEAMATLWDEFPRPAAVA